MEFKQYWRLNQFEKRGFGGICALMFLVLIDMINKNAYRFLWIPFLPVGGILFVFLLASFLCPGQLTNTIKIDSQGVSCIAKKGGNRFFRWEEIVRIEKVKTNLDNYGILSLFNYSNEQIWFYGSIEIQEFMFKTYPACEHMIEKHGFAEK